MILDNSLGESGTAYDTATAAIDLGGANKGRGEQLYLTAVGDSDCDITTLTITDGATSAAADSYEVVTVDIQGKSLRIPLREDIAQYVKLTPSGGSDGTYSVFVGAPPASQTNL